MNDLFSVQTQGTIIAFADDTAIVYEADAWPALKYKVERDLENLLLYFAENRLSLNLSKTNYIPFSCHEDGGPDFEQLEIQISGHNLLIKSSDTVNYLGIVIDPHLRWDQHIYALRNRLRHILFNIRRISEVTEDNRLRKMLYCALVEPHLSYGLMCWGSVTNNHSALLQSLQRTIIKALYRLPMMHGSDGLYQTTGIMDIGQMYYYKVAVKTYIDHTHLQMMTHNYETRNRMNTALPKMNTKKSQMSYYYNSHKVFNSLPIDIWEIGSLTLFKKQLRGFVLRSGRGFVGRVLGGM